MEMHTHQELTAEVLAATSIHLTEKLEKTNRQLSIYKQGVCNLKKLLDLEMDTINAHLQLEEKKRSIELFVNKLLQIMEISFHEISLLLEMSENDNLVTKTSNYTAVTSESPLSVLDSVSHSQDTVIASNEVNQQAQIITEDSWKQQISDEQIESNNCVYCNKQFLAKQALLRHIKIHTQKKPILCKAFNQTTVKNRSALYDLITPLPATSSSTSNELNEQIDITSTEDSWPQPSIVYTQQLESNNCPNCNRYFTTKRDLKRHIRIHTGEKPFACKVCSKSFSRKDFLRKHFLVHTQEKPHCCSECGKKFSQRSNLTKHFLIHSGDKYICNICSKGFSQRANLHRHHLTHSKTCVQCHKKFNNQDLLLKHMQQLHPHITIQGSK